LPNVDVEGKALEEDNHHDTSSEKGHVNDKNSILMLAMMLVMMII
jgi:RND superfamily putative drug exporter